MNNQRFGTSSDTKSIIQLLSIQQPTRISQKSISLPINMQTFAVVCLIALASGVVSENTQGGSYVQDTYTAPIAASVPKESYSAPSYESAQTYSYSAPSAPPTGSYYASDFAPAHNGNTGFGFGGNNGVAFPNAQNLISTGLSIVMLSKLAASSFFEKIFDGIFGDEDARYFDQGTIDQLTNLAVDAIQKFREQYEEKDSE
ncbi:unnamed protein product [Lepeophtheirus salmonis]|uniref:(salmon louse) hypothetical protein n=1 Tax=Lepeophtheirus salmonis TaxID=72036 RepID=A0A7R8CMT6_LEPSM|nr:unnamed protein product [Lepeophtheirus salmonis]CAF2869231.1 unnamed protein product [Lepeophtheirus salmonis]